MAEIKVEKKESNNNWIWIILGLLIAALLVYFLMFNDDDSIDDTDDIEQIDTNDASSVEPLEQVDTQEATRAKTMENPFKQTMAFVAYVGDKSNMGIDHEYTRDAMMKLVDATRERAIVADVNVDNELSAAVDKAQSITEDPQDTNHSDKIKQAYLSITDLIEKVQKEKFPQLSDEMQKLRTAAEDIDPTVLTLNQKDNVNGYFDEAAEVLQKMK